MQPMSGQLSTTVEDTDSSPLLKPTPFYTGLSTRALFSDDQILRPRFR